MSLKSIKLRKERQKIVEDSRALLDKAESENRGLSAEEEAQWQKMSDDIESYRTRIEREEEVEKLEREGKQLIEERGQDRGSKGQDKEAQERGLEIFNRYLRSGPGALTDADVRELRTLNSGVDAQGGFLVAPVEILNELLVVQKTLGSVRSMARVITLKTAKSLGVPTLEAEPSDPEWTAELPTDISVDDQMEFGGRQLNPTDLMKEVQISQTLIEYTPNVVGIVNDALARRFVASEENHFCNGTGQGGQPLGLFVASGFGIDASRDVSTGNEATSLKYDGLVNCQHHIDPAYRANASWLMNDLVLRNLRKLRDNNDELIFQTSIHEGAEDRLLGNPIKYSAFAPATFTTGLYLAVYGDFSNYWIVDTEDFQIAVVRELYIRQRKVGFIGRKKIDAMPVIKQAFARAKLA